MTRSPATPDDLFALLDRLGVAHKTHAHRPVFTVEESADLKAAMPGGHTKNLFLKDKKGALWLVCALAETRIDLNATSKALGAGRFSFGSAELLFEKLGVTPGSVTVFAVINDPNQTVRLALDAGLLAHDLVNFHPLRNDATTAIASADLMRLLAHLGRAPVLLAFDSEGKPQVQGPRDD